MGTPIPPTLTPSGEKRSRWPLSRRWTIILGVLTGGWALLVMVAIYFWRGGNRRSAYAAGIAALGIAVVALTAGNSGSHKNAVAGGATQSPKAAATTTDATSTGAKTQTSIAATSTATSRPSDPTMGVRTRVFISKLRLCQKAVRTLRTTLGVSDQLQPDQLATVANESKAVCSTARQQMATYNTKHFDHQAIDADVAVDDYKHFIDNISHYIDTQTASDIPKAQQALAEATNEAANAITEINERREIYGFSNI